MNSSICCILCNKEFKRKQQLTYHMLSHTGERPFGCSICSQRFRAKHHALRHELLHSGLKPFQCLICSKSFARRENLTAHLTIHTGERPFKCNPCQKDFRVKSDFNKHQRIKGHSNEVEQIMESFVARQEISSNGELEYELEEEWLGNQDSGEFEHEDHQDQ